MRADAARRRESIIAHAKRIFAERGGDVPLEAVAAASGVGIATLYRNFPSRQDLVGAVVDDIMRQILETVAAARGVAGQDPARAWTDLLAGLVELQLGALMDSLGVQARNAPDGASRLASVQQPALDALDELLAALRRSETIRRNITALELIVAVATITRPQAAPIREAAPGVQNHLVDAYLHWSRSEER